jgi:DNA-binding NarL/FixJ family response regulator
MRMQKILIADDHPLFREAIREVIARLFAARDSEFTTLEAANTKELFDIVDRGEDIDLILLDIFMPGSTGLADLVALRDRAPATPIVIISALEEASVVRRALACGAAGYIVKSASRETMVEALRVVLDGGIYAGAEGSVRQGTEPGPSEEPLTPRQVAVLALLSKGHSNKQIARELDIGDVTVKAHMTAILRKLGVATRAQAIVAFQRERATLPEANQRVGLVTGDPSVADHRAPDHRASDHRSGDHRVAGGFTR